MHNYAIRIIWAALRLRPPQAAPTVPATAPPVAAKRRPARAALCHRASRVEDGVAQPDKTHVISAAAGFANTKKRLGEEE
jgi:hypothetical protein